MNTKLKDNKRKKQECFIKAMRKAAFVCSSVSTVMTMATATGFAATTSTPSGADTSTFNSLLDIVLWVVRGAVLIIGIIPALIKIVQGQSDENTRDRNNGITSIVISGLILAATFAIKPIMTAF